MFQEKRLLFMYAISPVHLGAGTSLGVIDNPVQRERHTEHPVFAGSGLKGAFREAVPGNNNDPIKVKIFGPDSSGAEHAGAVSFSDGQVVAFPVRSMREGFVYVCSPLSIERLRRLASAAECDLAWQLIPSPADDRAIVLDDGLLSNGNLVLETYRFEKESNGRNELEEIAEWLSESAIPKSDGTAFFRKKLKKHLVMLSETQFSFFVRNAMVVEPHVRISDVSGTAEDTGLFFTENVPPEAIFVSMLMASQERMKKGSRETPMSADKIARQVTNFLNGKMVQIGGDATTGRGQVLVNIVG